MINYVNLEKKFEKYTRNDVIAILNRYADDYYIINESLFIANDFLKNYNQFLDIDREHPQMLFLDYYDQLYDYAKLKNYVASKKDIYCSLDNTSELIHSEVLTKINEQRDKEIYKLQRKKERLKEVNIDIDINKNIIEINDLYDAIINDYKNKFSKTKKLGN